MEIAVEQFRSIEIDFDVHRKIEMERKGFDEPPNAALRRLLGIDEDRSNDSTPTDAPTPTTPKAPMDRPWSGKGVSLPHGAELRMEYNGRVHTGWVEDGRWRVEGMSFNSPSAAAGGVATTKDGKHPSLDGWLYWQARLPGEHGWISIKELRRRASGK